MNRNVTIVIIILILVVIAGYFVWLRNRVQSPVVKFPVPTAEVTASPTATPATASATVSAKPKTATTGSIVK